MHWDEAICCLYIHLGQQGPSAKPLHNLSHVIHCDVRQRNQVGIDPVIYTISVREGEICDQTELPCVVALWY